MRTPTFVAYVELPTRPMMPPLRYMSMSMAGWFDALGAAGGGSAGARVVLAGRCWACRRGGRPGNCVAAQGVGRSGASEAGLAAVQFECGRGVQLRSGHGGRTGRVHGEPSPIPVAPRRLGRVRASRDERVSPTATRRTRRVVHCPRPELLPLEPGTR